MGTSLVFLCVGMEKPFGHVAHAAHSSCHIEPTCRCLCSYLCIYLCSYLCIYFLAIFVYIFVAIFVYIFVAIFVYIFVATFVYINIYICSYLCIYICNYHVTTYAGLARTMYIQLIYVGLARTVYMHRIWPYIWWLPCQKYRIYTVYMVFVSCEWLNVPEGVDGANVLECDFFDEHN